VSRAAQGGPRQQKSGECGDADGVNDGTVAWTKCKAVEPFSRRAHGERVMGRFGARLAARRQGAVGQAVAAGAV
jgi:hypothetical protein